MNRRTVIVIEGNEHTIQLALQLEDSLRTGLDLLRLFRATEPLRANMLYLAFHAFKEKSILENALRQLEKQLPRQKELN